MIIWLIFSINIFSEYFKTKIIIISSQNRGIRTAKKKIVRNTSKKAILRIKINWKKEIWRIEIKTKINLSLKVKSKAYWITQSEIKIKSHWRAVETKENRLRRENKKWGKIEIVSWETKKGEYTNST